MQKLREEVRQLRSNFLNKFDISSSNKTQLPTTQKTSKEEPQPEFFCPVNQSIMKDPVAANDGHSYERTVLQEWYDECKSQGKTAFCPDVPSIRLTDPSKFPTNITLRKMIRSYQERKLKSILAETVAHEENNNNNNSLNIVFTNRDFTDQFQEVADYFGIGNLEYNHEAVSNNHNRFIFTLTAAQYKQVYSIHPDLPSSNLGNSTASLADNASGFFANSNSSVGTSAHHTALANAANNDSMDQQPNRSSESSASRVLTDEMIEQNVNEARRRFGYN
jgi:hypothetical protein